MAQESSSNKPDPPLTPEQDYALGKLQVYERQVFNELEERLRTEVGGLPLEKQAKVTKVAKEVLVENLSYFTSDMPPPGFLKLCEEVQPGAAAQIMAMAADEKNHRHICELRELDQGDELIRLEHRKASYWTLGLVFGFLTLVVFAVAGTFALMRGATYIAAICFGSGIAGPIGAFIKGRGGNTNHDEVEEEMPPKSDPGSIPKQQSKNARQQRQKRK